LALMSSTRIARGVFIACAGGVLIMAVCIAWLKAHEYQLVFATARSQRHLLTAFPADAERLTVPLAGTQGLAALVFHADGAADVGYWVLHLHGNADSAFSASQVQHCEALRRVGFNVLDIDYRGFGLTPGHASESGMDQDAEAAYQALLRRGVPPNRIILLGHSLGSGPAVLLATRHRAAALVLFGAFTSVPDAAADRYPLLPVRAAVAVQFDSLARIPDVHMPVVIAHAQADTLIPYAHALKLYAAANEPKHLITFESAADDPFGGHVDALYDHADVLATVLAEMLGPAPAPSTL
jgi:alpha-beta hydrolase superfamily lysophospholipase